MTPEQLKKQLLDLSQENKKLKTMRKYKVDRMQEYGKCIQDYRHDIQNIDQIISNNTDKFIETSAELRALLQKITKGA